MNKLSALLFWGLLLVGILLFSLSLRTPDSAARRWQYP
jgi:hypothetical protein